jgi:predicted sulfurtransferase
MLPGSRVLTAAEYEQQRDALRDSQIICYCTVGFRSSKYANTLLEEGQAAVNMQGGILGWVSAATAAAAAVGGGWCWVCCRQTYINIILCWCSSCGNCGSRLM